MLHSENIIVPACYAANRSEAKGNLGGLRSQSPELYLANGETAFYVRIFGRRPLNQACAGSCAYKIKEFKNWQFVGGQRSMVCPRWSATHVRNIVCSQRESRPPVVTCLAPACTLGRKCTTLRGLRSPLRFASCVDATDVHAYH